MTGLIIAVTSAVALGWKIYSDIKKEKQTDAKISTLVKHLPEAVEEIREIKTEWKTYQKKQSGSAPEKGSDNGTDK